MLALCYFAAAKASLVFAIPPGYATAVWPPSGIALAALLLWGARAWPGVWLGAALTNYTVDLSIPAALGIATGNTLEGVCAAWLASRLTDRNAEFKQPEDVFAFAAVAALASAIAATVGVSSLYFTGAVPGAQYLGNWYTWWQGDTTGILLVTPCILAWARGARDGETRAGSRELALFGALLVATLLAVFARGPEAYDMRPLAFLVVPFFVWAACRFSERAVTLTVLAANGWAIWCTVNGLGPFQPSPLNEALLMLQAFTSTGALVAMVLWALLRYRAEALQLLKTSHDALGQSAWSRMRALREQIEAHQEAQALAHVGSWSWDGRSNRVMWSEELCRICGIEPAKFEGSFEAYFARVHPADRERVRDTIKDAYARHRSWDSIERIVRPDGEIRILRSIGRAALRNDGPATNMHCACIDVTGYPMHIGTEEPARDSARTSSAPPPRPVDLHEIERRPLAANLDDPIARSLTSLALRLDALKQRTGGWRENTLGREIDNAKALIGDSVIAIRDVISKLTSTALDDLGLLEALRAYAERFERLSRIAVVVRGGDSPTGLDARTQLALFRIAKEALRNIAKHAKARRVMVELECEPRLATLTVRDDGRGFRPEGQARR